MLPDGPLKKHFRISVEMRSPEPLPGLRMCPQLRLPSPTGCLNTSKLHETLYPWIATAKETQPHSTKAHSRKDARHVAGGCVLPIREDMLVQAGRLAMQVEIIDQLGMHLWTRSLWLKQARRGPPPPKFGA